MTQQGSIQDDREAQTTIADVRFEHYRDALGVGEARPRLSWIVATTTAGWRQTGYEIEAYGVDERLREQTGRVESDQSVFVSWPFAPLSSGERLMVRVRVWGNDGQPSAWSMPSFVEASRSQPAPLLRRTFEVRAGVTKARLYATALGVYEAHINGITVGDSVLDPGWTDYHYRLRYQIFDVTNLLHEGRNALGAMLADGWFCKSQH